MSRPVISSSNRLLPDDRSVEALSREQRQQAFEHWTRRARSELRVGFAFSELWPRLQRAGAASVVIEHLKESASQERRHSLLCLELAERYGERPATPPKVDDAVLPNFGTEDEAFELLLHMAGLCCINETIAVAWLNACLEASKVPLAVAAHRAHLAEEVGHARLGFAHLASRQVPEEMRHELSAWIPSLLRANVSQWLRQGNFVTGVGIPDHGLLGADASSSVIHEAVRDLVIPGFIHAGVPVAKACIAQWNGRAESL